MPPRRRRGSTPASRCPRREACGLTRLGFSTDLDADLQAGPGAFNQSTVRRVAALLACERTAFEHARRALDDLTEGLGRGPYAPERADALAGRHARLLGVGAVPVRHHVALGRDQELL